VISRRNAVSGSQVGLLSAGLNARRNVIEIASAHDLFDDNRAGCWLMAGIGPTSSGNVLRFAAHGATFRDNARAQTGWER